MIVVTGGAGFIGSNIVRGLNRHGIDDVLVVDDLTDGTKFLNLTDCHIDDYRDKDDFRDMVCNDRLPQHVRAVIHQGACSDTTEWNGRYMMDENYTYSRELLHCCLSKNIPFIYASSASVYGAGPGFTEDAANENPLNVYGFSKLQFDRYVRRMGDTSGQIVGLRYFNVYGPREQHKGAMASVAWHFNRQLDEGGEVRLFEGSDGYGNGEQRRDFVYVDDVVDVNLWFLEHPGVSGIFNVGTGRPQTFNDVARAIIDWHGRGDIRYVPFPEHLAGRYQSHTCADLERLRGVGCDVTFRPVEQGVKAYLDAINP